MPDSMALCAGAPTGTDHRGGLLGTWAAEVLRTGRGCTRTACRRGGAADRCHLRHRAQHQRPADRATPRRAPGAHRAAGAGSGNLDARGAAQNVPTCRCRQSHGLHAQAMGRLRSLPRRWPDLPQQQCRRTGTARYRDGRVIVHAFFKCLETLEAYWRRQSDTGAPFGRSQS